MVLLVKGRSSSRVSGLAAPAAAQGSGPRSHASCA